MTKKTRPELVTAKSGHTLAIIIRTAGQSFGSYAELRYGRNRVVASTDVRPYGFTGAVIDDARALAQTVVLTDGVER